MKKSNLSQEILKNIWSISSQSKKNGLSRDEFFIALRLIALAQNNFPFTKKEIETNNPIPPFPNFISFNIPNNIDNNIDHNADIYADNNNENEVEDELIYEIPDYNITLYRKFFENNKDSKGNYISTKKAIELWKSDTTSIFTIKRVANSLKPLEKIGFLNLKEFIVANHLLSVCNCHEIPIPLPNCLLKFMGRPLNKNKQKHRKSSTYKNFNDYLNKNSNNINNNQNEFNNNNEMYNNKIYDNDGECIKQNNIPKYELNNKLSDNEIDYQKFKSEENEKQEKKENINNNNKDDINLINNNENGNKLDTNNFIENNKGLENNNYNKDNMNFNDLNETNNIKEDINNKFVNENKKETENKLQKFRTSENCFQSNLNQNKINNINNSNQNDNILESILKRMEELEIKNEENNTQISLLMSKINSLQKEKNKINKEITVLKDEFKKIKSKYNINNNSNFKKQSIKIVKNNNSLNTTLNKVFSEEIKNEKNFLNENSSNKNFNQTINNNFQKTQKNLVIKRDEKRDLKKYHENTGIKNKSQIININENNYLKSRSKLKKQLNVSKKIPLDEMDKTPQNGNDNIND